MFICNVCGGDFLTSTRNHKICPSCMGRMGGRHKKDLQPKVAKLNLSGYLYYTHTMLTEEERALMIDEGRSILVHRLLMAKKIGRPLKKGEVVMHIDGNKLNNEPDNLMLGDQLTNIRQHWEARIDAERWKNISVWLFGLMRY